MHPTQKQRLWKVMHAKSGGQTPLHAGAAALPQATGGFLHEQPVPGPAEHSRPGGQKPPHCGAGLWLQATTMSTHPQLVVPGSPEQT